MVNYLSQFCASSLLLMANVLHSDYATVDMWVFTVILPAIFGVMFCVTIFCYLKLFSVSGPIGETSKTLLTILIVLLTLSVIVGVIGIYHITKVIINQ